MNNDDHLIEIPPVITLMSQEIQVCYDLLAAKKLEEDFGAFEYSLKDCRMMLNPCQSDDELQDTFIHEFLESVDSLLLNCELTHIQLIIISRSLRQLMDQLHIKFYLKDGCS